MQSNIIGTTMPVLEFILESGDAIISEAGELSSSSRKPASFPGWALRFK
jgi:hypothetical protein